MKKQVFISHQKRDRDAAQKIADYLIDLGISVYFDEYDKGLRIATTSNQIVDAIQKGIHNSTHMLCIISPNTLTSKWVPFEVGYGYDKTDLATLTLKGIKNSDLPDYIKVAPVIRDIYDINKFVEDKFRKKYLLESRNFSNYNNIYHPLNQVMDSIITS